MANHPNRAKAKVPPLEHHCGSWVVSRKADGSVIGEFFDRSNLRHFNNQTCRIETASQYLARINRDAK